MINTFGKYLYQKPRRTKEVGTGDGDVRNIGPEMKDVGVGESDIRKVQNEKKDTGTGEGNVRWRSYRCEKFDLGHSQTDFNEF